MMMSSWVVVLLILWAGSTNTNTVSENKTVREVFLSKLLKQIGTNGTITEADLNTYFTNYGITYEEGNRTIAKCVVSSSDKTVEECLKQGCLTPTDVFMLSGLKENVTQAELSTLAPILLHLALSPGCHEEQLGINKHSYPKTHPVPSSAEVWGYGFLLVTAINLCSLAGVVVLPFIHKNIYKKMLICMVAIAVGTLAGSSLLFLIPEALELVEEEPVDKDSYVWKSMTVILGIYSFFLIERFLKMIMDRRKIKGGKADEMYSSFRCKTPVKPEAKYKAVDKLKHGGNSCASNLPLEENSSASSSSADFTEMTTIADNSGTVSNEGVEEVESDFEVKPKPVNGNSNGRQANGHPPTRSRPGLSRSHSHSKPIAPVAWMIVFGDGIHNFIDGVSIGAAFTESILAGVSVSVAIFCEELPHELGDFAVLLNAGMSLKKAVMYNFLSASMCYLGLVLGIVLGENTAIHAWVFAFAGGMFLYISLVDMMPEMNSENESEENKTIIGGRMIFFLQNLGLLIGFGVMLVMAVFGGHISFE